MIYKKSENADYFAKAASSYDAFADVQRLALARVQELAMPYSYAGQTIIDAGCGTGSFAREWKPKARILQLDHAQAMCAKAQDAQQPALCGSVSAMPVKNATADMYVSSLCWQWVPEVSAALTELCRTLKPQGVAIIATLSSGTFCEMDASFMAQGHSPRGLSYASVAALKQHVVHSGMALLQCDTVHYPIYYANALSLMRHLKKIGAHYTKRQRLSATQLKHVMAYYDHAFAQEDRVIASYYVTYMVIRHGA